MAKAKEALELQEPGGTSTSEDRMQVVFEELQDLRGVWSELAKIWQQIDETKEKPWYVYPQNLAKSNPLFCPAGYQCSQGSCANSSTQC